MPDFAQLLSAASILSGATKTAASSKDVGEVLVRRLVEARNALNNDNTQSISVSNAELETALLALSILEQVQTILDHDECEPHYITLQFPSQNSQYLACSKTYWIARPHAAQDPRLNCLQVVHES